MAFFVELSNVYLEWILVFLPCLMIVLASSTGCGDKTSDICGGLSDVWGITPDISLKQIEEIFCSS